MKVLLLFHYRPVVKQTLYNIISTLEVIVSWNSVTIKLTIKYIFSLKFYELLYFVKQPVLSSFLLINWFFKNPSVIYYYIINCFDFINTVVCFFLLLFMPLESSYCANNIFFCAEKSWMLLAWSPSDSLFKCIEHGEEIAKSEIN